jgi:hypothetical protein
VKLGDEGGYMKDKKNECAGFLWKFHKFNLFSNELNNIIIVIILQESQSA